ncbi:FadR/GntR family transcriptional regulator [Puniceibacterium sediminis]|uniref:Transcriptional regulator, GntR family n=1 Tax=Puniceibacterium sediminis TaxID=1608407 RepID=A0A238YC74_9RHOB|nr:FadR/GntR family transcriptional regulator [Puniceibacterium sediminis]SNR68630.1 transcriptional regulator, GntR family [Puniceibacterium sediminis]
MQYSERALKADPMVEKLREFIQEGDYTAGDRLPAERDLTVRLEMSRTELRKALDALEREGFIWRHVGKGTFVAEPDGNRASDELVQLGRNLTPFRMMRARLVIEPAIAREAAINASGKDLSQMKRAMERARSATTWAEYEEQDDHLHSHIAEASDNLLLVSLFEHLNQVRRAVVWGSVIRDTPRPPATHTSFAEHAAIVQAIESRFPDAAYEAMRTHLRSVSDRLFGEA